MNLLESNAPESILRFDHDTYRLLSKALRDKNLDLTELPVNQPQY